MRIRKGSVADKFTKACNIIDYTKAGHVVTALAFAAITIGPFIYFLFNNPL